MLGKKFNDRDDLVLFEFSQRRIPLDEKVRGVDFPNHSIIIEQSLYRVQSMLRRRSQSSTDLGTATRAEAMRFSDVARRSVMQQAWRVNTRSFRCDSSDVRFEFVCAGIVDTLFV